MKTNHFLRWVESSHRAHSQLHHTTLWIIGHPVTYSRCSNCPSSRGHSLRRLREFIHRRISHDSWGDDAHTKTSTTNNKSIPPIPASHVSPALHLSISRQRSARQLSSVDARPPTMCASPHRISILIAALGRLVDADPESGERTGPRALRQMIRGGGTNSINPLSTSDS